jgi:hypothetical protein
VFQLHTYVAIEISDDSHQVNGKDSRNVP